VIAGIGTDILSIARIERVLADHGARFSKRILMPEEQAHFAKSARPANALAKAFAAKEAFSKAWGTGFAGMTHHDVGVARDAGGKPHLIFSAAMQARLHARGITAAHLSLSDDDGRVLAFVVLEAPAA
jgi:holo-[acyl-carrier protein] synthase